MREPLLFILVCLLLVSGFNDARAQDTHLLVDAREGELFGSYDGKKFAEAVEARPLLKEGEKFRLYTLTGPAGTGTVTARPEPEYPCEDVIPVTISPLPEGEGDLLGVNGSWDAQPRLPKVQGTNQPEYRNVVTSYLRGAGIARPKVTMLQLLRVDLDGDGTQEVLISANSKDTPGMFMSRGDFSVVLLRKVVGGSAQTIPVASEVELKNHKDPRQTGQYHHKETVAALLDVDGDGVMEVITTYRSTFDYGKAVYDVKGPKPKVVLSTGCGE
ncbi:MAG TPA: hypothetical protein VJT74_04200 [Pyrinomonadaceae bacterium]|nr:hypothetical protein [Pyrinomonadaceae bacterium]